MTGPARMIGVAALLALLGAAPARAAPPSGGSIAIHAEPGDAAPFVAAAADALAARGFVILDDGHAAYVADLVVHRDDVGTGLVKGSSGGPGVRAGGPGVGVGAFIPLGTGRSDLAPLRRTRLEIRVHPRGAPEVVWHGAATTVRAVDGKRGADATVAADLSEAVLRPYPAVAPDVVGIP